MSTEASSKDHGGQRIFSGNDEDPKEFRRWKAWVSSKLLTLSTKMPESAKGAFIYTLLSGKALAAVEHLEPEKYQKEGGDKVLLDLLSKRFPDKDASDEMSENLTDVFNLRANEGEALKAWISRPTEAFDKLQRKTNVRKKGHRDEVAKFLQEYPPELLVLCPPCTYEGGWHHLYVLRMSPQEALQKQLESRMYIRFCCRLYENQVKAGKRVIFEHPSGAKTWSYAKFRSLSSDTTGANVTCACTD
jgi:hypothetical protein